MVAPRLNEAYELTATFTAIAKTTRQKNHISVYVYMAMKFLCYRSIISVPLIA